jgi:hypothetical protein
MFTGARSIERRKRSGVHRGTKYRPSPAQREREGERERV